VPEIMFPAGSFPGQHPQESAGRLINAFVEELGEGARSRYKVRRSPGLRPWATAASATGARGAFFDGTYVYVAYEDTLSRFDSAGTETTVDALSGSEPVYFASNNAVTPDLVVVTENGPHTFTSSAVTTYADADLPTSVQTVEFGDGFFFFTQANGVIWSSGLNAVTQNAIDFTTAQAVKDGLYRATWWEGQLYAWGPESCEVYSNTGNPTGFPFSRVAVIDTGIAGPRAITGWQSGFKKGLFLVAQDHTVHEARGYATATISTPDLNRLISDEADKSSIEMYSYIVGGHAFVGVSGTDWTWEFNLTTRTWTERKSYLAHRWKAGGHAIHAFDKQLICDASSGAIYEIDHTFHKEGTEPLIFTAESIDVEQEPLRLHVPRAHFKCAAGVGIATGADPTETDPEAIISWSNDGGVSWGHSLRRKLGRQGEGGQSVIVNNAGLSGPRGRRWRFSVSAAVDVSLMGGFMDTEARLP
jgi:hypothetical protein